MIKHERQLKIEEQLKKNGSILVSSLSEYLDCSEETIRRDLREMENAGKLIRIYGGAYLPEKHDKGVPFELREVLFEKEKADMANIAVSMIKNNSVIALDSSSTCLKIAEEILQSQKVVTIITNSLKVCSVFNNIKSEVNVVCLGGQLHPETSSFTGHKTTDALKQNFVDISFISCPSIHRKYGLSDNNLNEAEVRKLMLNNSHLKVLVVDHTKINSISDILFYPLEDINKIITDKELNSEWTRFCKESSIEIHYA